MQKPCDIGSVIRAVEFAAQKHRMQWRKDSDASPYINHPIALMHVLCMDGGVNDPVVLPAAALHDTIEDTKTSAEELRAAFGYEFARLVLEMTDDKTLLKEERKRLQIEHAKYMSREGALIKLADKVCNLKDVSANPPADWDLERRRDYFEWARAVVDGLPPVSAELRKLLDAANTAKP
jgi:guanosine-3',5'-bis(diphosphate) 3'-pyrophosphohydrolase